MAVRIGINGIGRSYLRGDADVEVDAGLMRHGRACCTAATARSLTASSPDDWCADWRVCRFELLTSGVIVRS